MLTPPNSPTTIRVYRAISPKSLAALREPLARQVFRVSKYDEEHGRRSFVTQADGSWVYDNTLRRGELGQGKMVLKEEQDAREEAQKHIQYLQEIISKFPRLHAAFAEAPLLPQGLRFDRAERLIVIKNDTTEAASNPLWHWRVHYLLKFKPSGTEDYVPVEGGRCHIDLAPNGMILGAASGILPFKPNPSSSKRFVLFSEVRKNQASNTNLGEDESPESDALEGTDSVYAYNHDSGAYAYYYLGTLGKIAGCVEAVIKDDASLEAFRRRKRLNPTSDLFPINEKVSYDVTIPSRNRPIRCNNGGRLMGIVLFSADTDMTGNLSNYVSAFQNNVVAFWENNGFFVNSRPVTPPTPPPGHRAGYIGYDAEHRSCRFWLKRPGSPSHNIQCFESSFRGLNLLDNGWLRDK